MQTPNQENKVVRYCLTAFFISGNKMIIQPIHTNKKEEPNTMRSIAQMLRRNKNIEIWLRSRDGLSVTPTHNKGMTEINYDDFKNIKPLTPLDANIIGLNKKETSLNADIIT